MRDRVRARGRLIALGAWCLLPIAGMAGAAEGGGGESAGEWIAPAAVRGTVNPAAADPAAAGRGAALFAKYCLSCHGQAGRGDGPVAERLGFSAGDLTSPAVSKQTDGEIFWKIGTGRDPMPGFARTETLTEGQIWDVVVHMRTLNRDDHGDAKRNGPPDR